MPRKIYSAKGVRELDRIAIQSYGIAGLELMNRAGHAAFSHLLRHWPQVNRLVLLCGPGNNGGDGFVVARLGVAAGMRVDVILLADTDRLASTASQAHAAMVTAGVETKLLEQMDVVAFLRQLKSECPGGACVFVDAMFGTGLDRNIGGGSQGELIDFINQSSMPVLALDIPSGLDADTGDVLGKAVVADVTISFIGLKQGLLTGCGPDYCGVIHNEDLQIPAEVYQAVAPVAERMDFSVLMDADVPPLRSRKHSAHKGDFGHVLIVGGAPGMAGAVRMSAEASARVGAGLVSIATHPDHAVQICAQRPELMVHALSEFDLLFKHINNASVIGIGPGLGQGRWGRKCLSQVLDSLTRAAKPTVVDADALNLLAFDPVKYDHWVLTPHPAEAARLLGVTTKQVQADRYAAAAAIQQRYGGVCVLKGAGTIVHTADGCFVCSDGNPGMACGGMGDVLTGVIAGFLAQKMPLALAACLGVCIHAHAADLIAMEGQRGMLATDLFPVLRRLVNPVTNHAE